MPTPGEKLRATREARNLSIAQVVKVTRIRSYYIEAMEADDFSAMPSAVQARGFLRAYADFLGLDMETLIRPTQETISESLAEQEPETQIESETVSENEPEQEIEPEQDLQQTQEVENEPEAADAGDLPSPESQQPSKIIFRQIGLSLGQRRELLGLTLEEIERHTKIRQANLRVIEQGDFDRLPSPVQGRGMLKTYTSFLDMDSEAMLLQFAEGLQARRIERQAAIPAPRRRFSFPLWVRRLVSPDLAFGALIIFSITALILWGATRIIATQEIFEENLQAPSISDILLEPPQPETATPDASPITVEEQDLLPPPVEDNAEIPEEIVAQPGLILQVTLLINERVFLRVTVDGEIKQDGRVAPGAALVFDANERIEVLTGNGNAVQVIYNQIDLGILGNPGQVVNRIYTLDGIQTPTPTISPTPSNTPRFQPTPTPTLTSTPAITQVP